MPLPRLLAILVGLLIAAAGMLALADPGIPLAVARKLQSGGELYALAAVRVAMGVLVLWGARGSRMPRTLAVIGALMVLGGLVSPFFGVERVHQLLDAFEKLGPAGMRAAASLAVALGAFIVYAARPRAAAR